MAQMMRAIVVGSEGTASMGEAARPLPLEDELLVRVHASGVNRADLLQKRGAYPPPPGASEILGLEACGEVVEVGPACRAFARGDRVMSLLPGGGYAEYVRVPEGMAIRIPGELDYEQGAAIPEAFLTAYQALVWIARTKQGESVLIHAGASGVGTAAIQLTREIGAVPFATAGSDEKIDICRQLGAAGAFNYRDGAFAPLVREANAGRGVGVVIDFVGRDHFEQNVDLLETDGRLVFLALLSGSTVDRFDLSSLLRKRIALTGSTLRARPQEYKVRLTQELIEFALPKLANGALRPVVDKVYAAEAVEDAHAYMDENRTRGKLVLRWD